MQHIGKAQTYISMCVNVKMTNVHKNILLRHIATLELARTCEMFLSRAVLSLFAPHPLST